MTTDIRYFSEKLCEGLKSLDISLDDDAVERLYRYFIELKKWSAKVNLIAKGTADEQIIENHFLDSLTLLSLLNQKNVHLLDVGTGAGFPGLVLKAVNPQIQLTLVEPRLKRVSFLKQVTRILQLENVNVLACRVEDEKLLPSDSDFTHITSRAVTDIEGFLEMVSRFARPGLDVICMKGPRWQEELSKAEDLIGKIGFSQYKVVTCRLPFSSAERTLLVFRASQEV